MSDQIHVGTFAWGAVLAIAGAALAAVGFGWWDIDAFDLRYAAPLLVILVGGVILAGAFTQGNRRRSDVDPNG